MTRFLIILLALISGIATWYMLSSRLLAPIPDVQSVAPVTVELLVYSQDLRRGTRITSNVLQWEPRVETTVPADTVVRVDSTASIPNSLEGKLLRGDVLAGDPVRPAQLIEGSASFLALALRPGMRAVAIRVTPEKIAGGFILPDDQVDVVHTVVRDFDGNGIANGVSMTILRSVRVLAVGETATQSTVDRTAEEQQFYANWSSAQMAKGETVTLEVTEEQAQVLFSAAAVGQLSLSLRALEDHGDVQLGDVMTIAELLPQAQVAAAEEATSLAVSTATPQTLADLPAVAEVTVDPSTLVDPKSMRSRVTIIEGSRSRVVEVPLSNSSQ